MIQNDSPSVGVLVAALGTPDAPTAPALRRYLREFLGDRRVVDANRVLWTLLLNAVILPFRSPKSAALYRRVWTKEGSPLLLVSRAQAEGLATRLGSEFAVELGMRYGNPRLADALERIVARGIRRVVVLPMFPQFSCATTASVLDAVSATLLDRRDVPAWRVVRDYYDEPGTIDAIARIARETLGEGGMASRHFVLSFHGIPIRYVNEGDPYREHCEATARAIAAALGLPPERWTLAYQSKFGREEWLGPATDETLVRLAENGTTRVAVICPGFTADCLETIDEIGREAAHQFREAGGEEYTLVPCVNADPRWLDAIAALVRREVSGWI